MTEVLDLPISSWDQPCPPATQEAAVRALERGGVLLFPQLPFALLQDERRLLGDELGGARKNISLDVSGGAPRGSSGDAAQLALLHGMLLRYAQCSRALLAHVLPFYTAGLRQGRTSYRPAEIAGRTSSWRSDDTRLHVDSFPSRPVHGTRILRVFSNIHPAAHARTWRLGESFEDVAQRFLPRLAGPPPGAASLMQWLGITKSRRSAYDHFMLGLHDAMKRDHGYQLHAPQSLREFSPGSSWIVYTDQVSHAAMQGQYAMEQTWYLPVTAMHDAAQSPLRVLERLLGRELA